MVRICGPERAVIGAAGPGADEANSECMQWAVGTETGNRYRSTWYSLSGKLRHPNNLPIFFRSTDVLC